MRARPATVPPEQFRFAWTLVVDDRVVGGPHSPGAPTFVGARSEPAGAISDRLATEEAAAAAHFVKRQREERASAGRNGTVHALSPAARRRPCGRRAHPCGPGCREPPGRGAPGRVARIRLLPRADRRRLRPRDRDRGAGVPALEPPGRGRHRRRRHPAGAGPARQAPVRQADARAGPRRLGRLRAPVPARPPRHRPRHRRLLRRRDPCGGAPLPAACRPRRRRGRRPADARRARRQAGAVDAVSAPLSRAARRLAHGDRREARRRRCARSRVRTGSTRPSRS